MTATNNDKDLMQARLYLAALGTDNALTEDAHLRREESLGALPALLANFNTSQLAIDQLCTAYMMCSYGERFDKHTIKLAINALFKREMLHEGILPGYATPKRKGAKPHLLIVSTFMRSTHAMFRWYAKAIRGMRRHFEITGLTFTDLDEAGAALFDRAIVAPMTPAPFYKMVEQVTALINDAGPDAIFYADTAMHPFGICLSNLRLAPLQVLAAGHPASSYSRQVDYFMIEDVYAKALAHFTERPALIAESTHAIELPIALPIAEREDSTVRVLVPATMPKLSYPLLKACAKIARALPPAVELHITTHAEPSDFPLIEHQIHSIVPSAKCYPRLSTALYFYLLDQCSVFANPFPFGGSTTVLDCLSRGMPGVSMTGTEMFELSGPVTMRRCELPTLGTIAHSEREYVSAVINLAINRPLREQYAHNLRTLFGSPERLPIFAPRAQGYGDKLATLYDQRSASNGRPRNRIAYA